MVVRKIHKAIIIGSPGSGKSTFARKLRDKICLPLYYLDQIWHKPDRTNVTREEFDRRLNEILQKGEWIIDGNYQRTLEMRITACDIVFLFDLPTEVCLEAATSRIGTKREDLPWIENELDEEFRQWIVDFSKKQLPQIYDLLSKYAADKCVHIFKSREESDLYLSDSGEKSEFTERNTVC
jgi:adenylate kinase family enzyme